MYVRERRGKINRVTEKENIYIYMCEKKICLFSIWRRERERKRVRKGLR